MIIGNVIALILLVTGCIFVVMDNMDEERKWPMGGAPWRFYAGYTITVGSFGYLWWSVS